MTTEAEASGPLDTEVVYFCPGCGCLIVDRDLHRGACGRGADPAPEPLGPRIVEWLDEFDPEQLWTAAMDDVSLDASPAEALLAELKRLAAAL